MKLEEADFEAEETLIEIVSSRNTTAIHLISGTIGPFRPLQRSKIPLWTALLFKQKLNCTIIPPTWLQLQSLENSLREEKADEKFSDLPFHWLQIAFTLLKAYEIV